MDLYQPKLRLFFNEMVGVFVTPFILMFSLPNCVDRLLEFVVEYSEYIDGVGDICSFSRFDFQRFDSKFVSSNAPASPPETESKATGNEAAMLSAMSSMHRNVSSASNISAASNPSSLSSDDRNKESVVMKP